MTAQSCARCTRPASFTLAATPHCSRHALLHRPMLRRSLLTALVVGTVLVGINQGNVLLDGRFPAALWWKIPLTFAVPFGVATWGGLINSRVCA
jgi:hypothetical protein